MPSSFNADQYFADGGKVKPAGGPANVSPAQREAGNFKKKHESVNGVPVAIENPKGSTRIRADSGASKMAADYGQILNEHRAEDNDGKNTDTFVGPHKHSDKVFVVNQQHPHTGKFNEHKVLLGYNDRAHALRDYAHSFSDGLGHKRIQSVVEMHTHQLKDWLKKAHHDKPLRKADGGSVSAFADGGPVDLPEQVSLVAHDIARIAHKDRLDQRHLAYLLKMASGNLMPPDRAMEFAGQIMTGDSAGLVQRFQTYVPSARTFARLNEMLGGKHDFMGKGHMGKEMERMKGVDALQRTKDAAETAMDSEVVRDRPAMRKALKRLSKRI